MDLDRRVIADAIAERLADPAEASRFPAQPPEGSVLRFEVTHSRKPNAHAYTYVALRVGDEWYITGRGSQVLDWDDLARTIGNNPCHLVTEYREIPHLPTDPRDEIGDPRAWFDAVFGGENGQDDHS